jgi:hypothetical protein
VPAENLMRVASLTGRGIAHPMIQFLTLLAHAVGSLFRSKAKLEAENLILRQLSTARAWDESLIDYACSVTYARCDPKLLTGARTK